MSSPEAIDVTREDGVTLTCARCGVQRSLPRNWRQLMQEDPLTPPDWDGVLRCQASHLPEPMHGFEGVENEDGQYKRWRGRCACGHEAPWTADKDAAWEEMAAHLLPALLAAMARGQS
jgi:hypothetical protein